MGLFEEPALRGECTEKPMVLLLLLCTLAISAQDDVLDLVVRGRQRRPSLERGGGVGARLLHTIHWALHLKRSTH